MTYMLPSMFDKNLDKFLVGFDSQFNRLARLHSDVAKNLTNYPPYNIRKTGALTYAIEIAVAGFGPNDVTVDLDDGTLTIKGTVSDRDVSEDSFLHRGIAAREFTRTFALDDQVEVRGAELVNGMLRIALERVVPESKKPRRIAIEGPMAGSAKQLLQETK